MGSQVLSTEYIERQAAVFSVKTVALSCFGLLRAMRTYTVIILMTLEFKVLRQVERRGIRDIHLIQKRERKHHAKNGHYTPIYLCKKLQLRLLVERRNFEFVVGNDDLIMGKAFPSRMF